MALKKQFDTSATFSMASRTDVIFLLLIFFMVTSTFVFPNALEVNLPESAAKTIVITPSAALSTHAPHAFPLPPGNTLITEDNLPPRFEHPDTVLIPYIAAEDLIQPDSFDY